MTSTYISLFPFLAVCVFLSLISSLNVLLLLDVSLSHPRQFEVIVFLVLCRRRDSAFSNSDATGLQAEVFGKYVVSKQRRAT